MNELLHECTTEEVESLLGVPDGPVHYLTLTVRSGFCCPNHCPQAWACINAYLSPWGTLDTREKILIEENGARLIFKHRETGWEIVSYLGFATASLALATSIANLISALLTAMKRDPKTQQSTISIDLECITRSDNRRWETVTHYKIQVALPLSDEAVIRFGTVMTGAIQCLAIGERQHLTVPSKAIVCFILRGCTARHVELAGDFNSWAGQEMTQTQPSEWVEFVELVPGKHYYKFIVDGKWITDPENPGTEEDDQGNLNSVLSVQ